MMAAVPWLIIAAVVQHAGDLLNVGSFTGRGTARPTAINLVSAGVALTAYLLLIPELGVMGAVIATVTAYAARLALFLADSQRRVPLSLPWVRLALYAALAVGAARFMPAGLGWFAGGLTLSAACLIAAAMAVLLDLAPLPARFRRAT